jgi:hypothetical protein
MPIVTSTLMMGLDCRADHVFTLRQKKVFENVIWS